MARLTRTNGSPLRLSLFGTFRLERETQPIQLLTRKVKSLFAFLALHPEPQSREKLATLFWGDFTDEPARASLRNALAAIRQSLGNDILFTDRGTVQLDLESLWIDVKVFQKICDARTSLGVTDADIEQWQAAVELYRGDLLADFYDEWIAPIREKLRAQYVDLLLRLVQALRARGEYIRAIHYARRALMVEPANEKVHQNIMVCFVAIGDRHAALRQYEECKQSLRNELAVEPSPETQSLYQWIQTAETRLSAQEAALTNLPTPLTEFVGRKAECRELERLVRQTRLVTLTGAGGCGKTRLAIQVASKLVRDFNDGVWWVDLASLFEGDRVPQAIAKVLGVRESASHTLEETLGHYLRGKHLLLLLDGCEHLVEKCACLAERYLNQCPQLHLFATSREPLGISGEVVWPVLPLRVPALDTNITARISSRDIAELMTNDAVQLFVKRAALVNARFALNEKNAGAVVEICRRLDGLPLAIELAAARTQTMTVSQIVNRLNDRFRWLTSAHRNVWPHHQTMQAALDWSYNLLSDGERALFRRLAIFLGGWTLEAAEQIVSEIGPETSPLAPVNVLEGIARLVAKSLIVVDEGEEMRYRMLETVREYARQKLIESGEFTELGTRHRDWFLRYVEECEPRLRRSDQIVWLERLEADYENLHAALRWSFRRPERSTDDLRAGLRLVNALCQFWAMHGMLQLGRQWCEHALQEGDPADNTTRALYAQVLSKTAVLAYMQGDLAQAHSLCEKGLDLARQMQDDYSTAICLYVLSACERSLCSNLARAERLLTEGLTLARTTGNPWLIAAMLLNAGLQALAQGKHSEARAHLEEGLQQAEQVGDRWIISALLTGLGNQAYTLGDCERAMTLYERGLAMRRELKDKSGIVGTLNDMGRAVCCQGDWARARELLNAGLALSQELDQRESTVWIQSNLVYVELKQGNPQTARQLLSSSLETLRDLGNRPAMLHCLTRLTSVLSVQGEWAAAARLLGATQRLRQEMCLPLASSDQADFDAYVAQAQEALGPAAFRQAREQGEAMSWEGVVDYAIKLAGARERGGKT